VSFPDGRRPIRPAAAIDPKADRGLRAG